MNDQVFQKADEAPNQAPPLDGYDAYGADPWLKAATARAGVEDIAPAASELGRFVASAEGHHHAMLANRFTPELKAYDRVGRRIDLVEYHPSYHVLMRRACAAGLHSLAWTRKENGFSARAVLFYLWNQLEQGTSCPVTMTFASIPVFEHAPQLAAHWRGKVLATAYDPRPLPLREKTGATIGMAMTEKQGGSDLRAVQTSAWRDGSGWRITGHKWFCSAPMSDGFFTLARLREGVTCFFVPRSLSDGTRNAFRLLRLKDKVGNRSNASSEVEFEDTQAHLVGEPGRGIATLIEMAHHTRFDIVVAAASMMRLALNHALHHARHRSAFGRRLEEHDLMANVLADMALEVEAAALLAFRLAQAFDARDGKGRALQRALTPIAKYWLCRRLNAVATEAMECLGGNGYVEESSPLARLYREAPLNGIWEGSANVIALDALRAFSRSPEGLSALVDEISAAGDPELARRIDPVARMLADPATAERNARTVAETLALCMQAALMRRHSDGHSAEAFCGSRLGSGMWGRAFGTLAADGAGLRAIIGRARIGI